jgi:hypothetical protein
MTFCWLISSEQKNSVRCKCNTRTKVILFTYDNTKLVVINAPQILEIVCVCVCVCVCERESVCVTASEDTHTQTNTNTRD